MKTKPKTPSRTDDLRPEYDFSKGVRGKYAESFRQGAIAVVLEPDVAEVFKNAESVNRALRLLASIAKNEERK